MVDEKVADAKKKRLEKSIYKTFIEISQLKESLVARGYSKDEIVGKHDKAGNAITPPNAQYYALYTKITNDVYNYVYGYFFTNHNFREMARGAGVEIMKCIRECLWNFDKSKTPAEQDSQTAKTNGESPEQAKEGGEYQSVGRAFLNYVTTSIYKEVKRASYKNKKKFDEGCENPLQTTISYDSDAGKYLVDREIAEKNTNLLDESFVFHNEDDLKYIFCVFDKVFLSKQERARDFVSALITRELLEELSCIPSLESDYEAGLLRQQKFACDVLISEYLQDGKIRTQESVAAMYGKDKTAASRLMKEIRDKSNYILKGNP